MMCAECGGVFALELGACPCGGKPRAAQTEKDSERPAPPTAAQANAPAMTDNANATSSTTQPAAGSTLIEFPGVNRKPAWRKELSERFREIQQRRAREAAIEDEHDFLGTGERGDTYTPPAAGGRAADAQKASSQLGLVPTPDEPEMNPLVAAALRRIERARSQQPSAHVTRGGSQRGAARA